MLRDYPAATTELPTGAKITWLLRCSMLCPATGAVILLLGVYTWDYILPFANHSTLFLVDTFGEMRYGRGKVAYSIAVIAAAALASIGPSIAFGLSRASLRRQAVTAACVFPWVLVVMSVIAGMIHENAWALSSDTLAARLASNYLVGLSAIATALALGYSLWVRVKRDAISR